MAKLDKFIHSIIDSRTGQEATYIKVTKWLDNTEMTDSKVDNVLFKKKTAFGVTDYYKRVLPDGCVFLSWYGVKGDNTFDNYNIIQGVLNYFPKNSSVRLRLGEGLFYCSNELFFVDRRFDFQGEGLNSSALTFPPGKIGIKHARELFSVSSFFAGFSILAKGRDATDGLTASSATIIDNTSPETDLTLVYRTGTAGNYKYYTRNPRLYKYHGFYSNAVCQVVDVAARSFSGHGFRLEASISNGDEGDPVGYDASLSYFLRVKSSSCTCGIVFSGADSNQSTIAHGDFRNQRLYGAADFSFLGNHWDTCHASDNKHGHFWVGNSNSHATFKGCYGEGGSVGSYLKGYAMWLGGIHPDPIITDQYSVRWDGYKSSTMYFGAALALGEDQIYMGGPTGFINIKPVPGETTQWAIGRNNGTSIMGIFQNNSPIVNTTRFAPVEGINVQTFYHKGKYIGWVNGMAAMANLHTATTFKSMQFVAGDAFRNENPTDAQVKEWVCTRSGSYNTYAEGLTATSSGATTLLLSGATGVLKIGDVLSFGGNTRTIQSVSADKLTLTLTASIPAVTNAAISYITPVWRATGSGFGTLAERPTMRADDIGWRYFHTDNNTTTTWNGTAWI